MKYSRRYGLSTTAVPFALTAALTACGDITSSRTDPDPASPCASVRVHAGTAGFSTAALAARRSAVLDDHDVVVVGAGWDMGQASGDSLRQASDFYYLTGLEHAAAGWLVLIAREDSADQVTLYLPPGGPAAPQGQDARTATGISDVRCLADAPAQLAHALSTLSSPDPIALSASPIVQSQPAFAVPVAAADSLGFSVVTFDTRHYRAVKDQEEIEYLRRTARITASGLLNGIRTAQPGLSERDVQDAVEGVFADSGAARLAFGSIIASGANALELHYRENDDVLQAGDLIVADVGAEFARYSGDVARTFPVSGTFTPRQKELYEHLLRALHATIDSVRPGLSMNQLEAITRYHLNDGDSPMCGAISCDARMNHFAGHFVGLDVHDLTIRAIELVPGVVLNVEPGIYIPEEGIGLRIEETVLVTAAGVEVLSIGAPLSVEAIEAAMAAQASRPARPFVSHGRSVVHALSFRSDEAGSIPSTRRAGR